jgi:hypothetical protein
MSISQGSVNSSVSQQLFDDGFRFTVADFGAIGKYESLKTPNGLTVPFCRTDLLPGILADYGVQADQLKDLARELRNIQEAQGAVEVTDCRKVTEAVMGRIDADQSPLASKGTVVDH